MTVWYADGSGWNGKESKVCIVERDELNQFNKHVYIIRFEYQLTNNEAEYYALILALTKVKPNDEIRTFSQLVLNQTSGEWRVNFPHLQRLCDIVRAIKPQDVKISWEHDNQADKILK